MIEARLMYKPEDLADAEDKRGNEKTFSFKNHKKKKRKGSTKTKQRVHKGCKEK